MKQDDNFQHLSRKPDKRPWQETQWSHNLFQKAGSWKKAPTFLIQIDAAGLSSPVENSELPDDEHPCYLFIFHATKRELKIIMWKNLLAF